jgi:hypothetical protein
MLIGIKAQENIFAITNHEHGNGLAEISNGLFHTKEMETMESRALTQPECTDGKDHDWRETRSL